MVEMTVTGVDFVVTGLEEFGPAVQEAAFRGVLDGMKIAFEASKAMISESDHTLKDLARLGHPYSKADGRPIHSPDEVIHTQSDKYLHGLKAIPPRSGSYGSVVEGKIVNDDPKDRWLQEGTTTMRARPWMAYVIKRFGEQIGDAVQHAIDAMVARKAA